MILTDSQLSAFCGSIAMLLHAGGDAGEGAALFARDCTEDLAADARAFAGWLEQGESFARAAELTGIFPDYALSVISTAELSGRLEEGLEHLAEHYERQQLLRQRLRAALTYPAALLSMMCLVLGVLVFGVLPMFRGIYDSITGTVMGSVYGYVPAATFVGGVCLVLTAAVSVLLLALSGMLRRESGRKKLEKWFRQSPFTRDAARTLAVSRLTDTLATMLASGADPDTALERGIGVTEHPELLQALEQCRQQMAQGQGLAQALVSCRILPGLQGRLLLSGSRGGNTAQALESVTRQLSREGEEGIHAAIDRIEPVLVGFLTVSVGLTLIAVMLPLLGILGSV